MESIPKLNGLECETIIRSSALPKIIFNDINEQIINHITSDDLVDFMKSQKTPPIRDSKTNELIVDTSKRQCKRFTFGKHIIKHFANIVEPYLKEFLYYDEKIKDIKVDPSHGDILYYDEGGFFKKHRDQVPDICPFYPKEFKEYYENFRLDDKKPKNYYERNEWTMYTFIVCLDTTQDTNDGNTIVWSVDDNIRFSQNISEHSYYLSGLPAICHSFKLNKMNWLLFSSESVHEASPLLKDKMTLKLKLDVWLRYSKFYEFYEFYEFQRYKCPCSSCSIPLTYRQKVILRYLTRFDKHLTRHILEYSDFTPTLDRCVYKALNITGENLWRKEMCSCVSCMDNIIKEHYTYVEDEQESYGDCNDYDDYDDYHMCNGYEH